MKSKKKFPENTFGRDAQITGRAHYASVGLVTPERAHVVELGRENLEHLLN